MTIARKPKINYDRQERLMQELLEGKATKSLAEKLGCSQQAVCNWLNGESTPEADALAKIAKLKGWNMEFLYLWLREEEGSYKPPFGEIAELYRQLPASQRLTIGINFIETVLDDLVTKRKTMPTHIAGSKRQRLIALIKQSEAILNYDILQTIKILFPDRSDFQPFLEIGETVTIDLSEEEINRLLPYLAKPSRWEGNRPIFTNNSLTKYQSVNELLAELGNGFSHSDCSKR